MKVKILEKGGEGRWDAFVRNSRSSTSYHQSGWKNVVERTYGHKPFYLFSEEDKRITGILPLFLIEDMFWGKRLVSLPFASYGDICSENIDTSEGLLAEADGIMRDLGARYVELRCRGNTAANNRPVNDKYVTYVLKLSDGLDNIWRQMNQKRRNTIRKAQKYGLTVELAESGVQDFYALYARRMRELGTPVHSCSFFKELKAEFPGSTKTMFVRYDGRLVAGLFLLLFNGTMLSGWSASLGEYLYYAPNDLLYWEATKYGCEHGFEYFDFGRSLRDTGIARFKKEWGGAEVGLKYYYLLNDTESIPDINLSNPRYDSLSRIWRRLPLIVANRVGPVVRKRLV